MDPQTMALLQFLMGGMGGMGQQSSGQDGLGDEYSQFTLGGAQSGGNEAIQRAIGGFSPVNQNPNYGSTVTRFFDQNPLAGSKPFTGANPLQPGNAGANATRSSSGHSSFLPNDFGTSMQRWT